MVRQDSANEVLFEEVQQFRQPWLWSLLLILLLAAVVGLIYGLLYETVLAMSLVVPGLIWGGIAVFLFLVRMTVQVDHHHLHVRFLPLLKDIPLEDIAEWQTRTYRPLLEYGGWGLRYGWKGWAYNVSGNRGVQLVLTNGKRILIGSQKPEELAAAITKGKG